MTEEGQDKPYETHLTSIVEAIENFPIDREVIHCNSKFCVSPFAHYGVCPRCGVQLKLRHMSAHTDLEDVFDAVFHWMNRPGAHDHAQQRIQELVQEDEAAR